MLNHYFNPFCKTISSFSWNSFSC